MQLITNVYIVSMIYKNNTFCECFIGYIDVDQRHQDIKDVMEIYYRNKCNKLQKKCTKIKKSHENNAFKRFNASE